MKNFILLLILIFSISSCSEKRTTEDFVSIEVPRYSYDADTVYKRNSTEISHIDRTFYVRNQTRFNTYLKISNIVGTEKYTLFSAKWSGDEVVGSNLIQFSDEGTMDEIFNIIDTLFVNKDKELMYDIEEVWIYHQFLYGEDRIIISEFKSNDITESKITFTKPEFDSLRIVYNKYKLEETLR